MGPAGNAQLGPGDTAGRGGWVTPRRAPGTGEGSFFSCRDKGNRDLGGGRDPRPRKDFPMGCEFSPSSWHCPPETLSGTFQRPCPPPPHQPRTVILPRHKQAPPPSVQRIPAGSAGALRGSWPLGVQVGAGLRTRYRGRQEKLVGSQPRMGGRCTLHGQWDPKSPH